MSEVSAPNQLIQRSHPASLLGTSSNLEQNILTSAQNSDLTIASFSFGSLIQGTALPRGGADIPWLTNTGEVGIELPPQLQLLIDNFLLQGIDRVDAALRVPLELLDRVIDSFNLRSLAHSQTTATMPLDNRLFRETLDAAKPLESTQRYGPVLDLYELEIPKLNGDFNFSSSAAIRTDSGPELSISNTRSQPQISGNGPIVPTPPQRLPERASQRTMPPEQTPRPYDEPRKRKFRRKAEALPKRSFKEHLHKLLQQTASALNFVTRSVRQRL